MSGREIAKEMGLEVEYLYDLDTQEPTGFEDGEEFLYPESDVENSFVRGFGIGGKNTNRKKK